MLCSVSEMAGVRHVACVRSVVLCSVVLYVSEMAGVRSVVLYVSEMAGVRSVVFC